MSATALFSWSDHYKVGIQEVDEQHQILVSLLNQLHDALKSNLDQPKSREILDRLAEYTRTHFLLEESLMRLTHYPGFEQHKEQHENLVKQMQTLQIDLDKGGAAIDSTVLQFLKTWLIQHITEKDRDFGSFFQTAGLTQYASWSNEVQTTMKKKKWWWKFW